MKIHPVVVQQNGIVSVTMQALFVGDMTDPTDKQLIQAYGDPLVNLGGLFTTPAVPATPGTPGTPAVPATPGTPAVPAVPATPGTPAIPAVPDVPADPNANPPTLDIPGTPAVPAVPGTPAIPAVPAVPATAAIPAVAAVPGTPAIPAFAFTFPASELYVGLTTQMATMTARFMTALPPSQLPGWPPPQQGVLDSITNAPVTAATVWAAAIEGQALAAMTMLRLNPAQLMALPDASI